jgi:hypothetical protein
MTTSYPGAYDNYTDKIDNVSTVLATSVNNLQDAMEAMQALVGKIDSNNENTWNFQLRDFFEENVLKMYFFQATAPVGWTIDTVASQCAIAIKGGSDEWNITGGTYYSGYGTYGWTIDDLLEDAHRHRWHVRPDTIPYMYDIDGETMITTTAFGEVAGSPMNNIQKGTDYRDNYDSGYFTWSVAHGHPFLGNWRARGAIGIVAKYTGA